MDVVKNFDPNILILARKKANLSRDFVMDDLLDVFPPTRIRSFETGDKEPTFTELVFLDQYYGNGIIMNYVIQICKLGDTNNQNLEKVQKSNYLDKYLILRKPHMSNNDVMIVLDVSHPTAKKMCEVVERHMTQTLKYALGDGNKILTKAFSQIYGITKEDFLDFAQVQQFLEREKLYG